MNRGNIWLVVLMVVMTSNLHGMRQLHPETGIDKTPTTRTSGQKSYGGDDSVPHDVIILNSKNPAMFDCLRALYVQSELNKGTTIAAALYNALDLKSDDKALVKDRFDIWKKLFEHVKMSKLFFDYCPEASLRRIIIVCNKPLTWSLLTPQDFLQDSKSGVISPEETQRNIQKVAEEFSYVTSFRVFPCEKCASFFACDHRVADLICPKVYLKSNSLTQKDYAGMLSLIFEPSKVVPFKKEIEDMVAKGLTKEIAVQNLLSTAIKLMATLKKEQDLSKSRETNLSSGSLSRWIKAAEESSKKELAS